MTARIIKFSPSGDSSPDAALQRAIGQYQNVVIIGYDHDGDLDCRADVNTSRKEILWMLEQFKLRHLLAEDGK